MDLPQGHQAQGLLTFAGRGDKKSAIGGHGLAVVGICETEIQIEDSRPVDGCLSAHASTESMDEPAEVWLAVPRPAGYTDNLQLGGLRSCRRNCHLGYLTKLCLSRRPRGR